MVSRTAVIPRGTTPEKSRSFRTGSRARSRLTPDIVPNGQWLPPKRRRRATVTSGTVDSRSRFREAEMSRLTFPAIIPVRNATEEELAAAARASATLQAGRRLADWFGDDPVDAESGWRSAHAQRDAAMTLGLVARGDAMTDETASRLHWIYEVAYHAEYVRTSEDHQLIHRAEALRAAAERTDAEIIADWSHALDALYAHGVEHALPLRADPAPLDFDGIGSFPIFKLLEQHGTATTEILSAEIAEGATEGMTPSYGRLRWTAWTARHGDPTAAFLRLAAEFGAVTVDGRDVSLTPLGAWAVIQQLGATIEVLPAAAELTPLQLIICQLGMSGEAFEQELQAWLASRAILAGYATGGPDGVAAAVRQAAALGPETVLFEQMWRSRHVVAEQALRAAGKLHPDKKIAKAARTASVKAASARNSAG